MRIVALSSFLLPFALVFTSGPRARSESLVHIDFQANLGSLDLKTAGFPISFHEADEERNQLGLRWDFRLLQGPDVSVTLEGGLRTRAKFYGDIETTRFLFGCHLGENPGVYREDQKWVYVDVLLEATPTVQMENGNWFLRASKVIFTPTLGSSPSGKPSDVHCAFFNWDVKQLLENTLARVKQPAEDAIRNALATRSVKIPVAEAWTTMQGPFALGEIFASKVCLYPNLSKVKIGGLAGTLADLHLGIDMTVNPEIRALASSCPSPAAVPPKVEQ